MKSERRRLASHCGLRLLKPQRLCNLSSREEEARCHVTWQLMDRALWTAGFAGDKELSEVSLRVSEFKDSRTELVIVCLDQVPFRAKISGGKQLYLAEEHPGKSLNELAEKEGKSLNEGQRQSRGQETADAAKYRITVELCQVILNYWHPGKDPVGIAGPTAIVVAGKHCRLSNIAKDGTWKENEEFYVGKVKTQRIAGESARAHMPEWQRIRNENPGLFEGPQAFEVYAQPAAVVDGIIQGWQLQALSQRFPGGILQRDMLGSYRSAAAQASMKALNWIDSPILGKMTPCLQLTDTDLARRLKVFAEQEKELLRQELVVKARTEKVKPYLVMKVPEVWRICSRRLESIKRI